MPFCIFEYKMIKLRCHNYIIHYYDTVRAIILLQTKLKTVSNRMLFIKDYFTMIYRINTYL